MVWSTSAGQLVSDVTVYMIYSIGGQKKMHVCHIEGCNKVYGKTSHLRAHLR